MPAALHVVRAAPAPGALPQSQPADLSFQVLGPLEVSHGGRPLPVSGRTTLVLLAGLVLSAGRLVPVDSLIEWIWGADLPARPRGALHSGVARLRRVLGEDLVETAPLGYRLRAEGFQVDLLRFRARVADAASALAVGADEDALDALDDAVRLWRGAPLSNVDSPALQREAVPQLTEEYLRVVEQRAELCLRRGRNAAVVQELSALVHRHPFHERLVGLLMIALMRSRRQADALAAYHRLREALAAELGIDPSPALRDLQSRILRADPGWEARPREEQPDWLSTF
jgi:DNA-binding SARP family transcriptional activator